MIERVHLLGIEENAALAIALEGVVIPGIPQTKDDVRKLTRALVALILWHVFVTAEVERRRMVSGCDEVPSGASVTDMIERRELAGERERLLECRACGADEPDVFRHRRQSGEQVNGSIHAT